MPAPLIYSKHLRAMVTAETRERLDRLEREHPESLGHFVREALAAGLPVIERKYERRSLRRTVGASQ